jgi:hypothetical protein
MRHLALAVLFAFTVGPRPLSPQEEREDDGPGTEWRECRADAHYDMALCYEEQQEVRFGYMICNLAWELDLLGCDAVLLEAICPFNWCEKET